MTSAKLDISDLPRITVRLGKRVVNPSRPVKSYITRNPVISRRFGIDASGGSVVINIKRLPSMTVQDLMRDNIEGRRTSESPQTEVKHKFRRSAHTYFILMGC